MHILMLCLRGNILQGEERERLASMRVPNELDDTRAKEANDDTGNDKEQKTTFQNADADDIELNHIYSRPSIDSVTMRSNPLHDQIPDDERPPTEINYTEQLEQKNGLLAQRNTELELQVLQLKAHVALNGEQNL